MPDINTLLENESKKKFKKSSYRPWNYLEEIEKEETQKQQDVIVPPETIPIVQPPALPEKNEWADGPQKKTLDELLKSTSQNRLLMADNDNNEKSTSPLYIILRLSGHQKTIFTFILEKCLSHGLLSSGVVTSDILTSITNTSLSMVNTSIQRLVDKKLICRENGKRGRGGFYCFSLSQEVNDAAIEYRRLATLDAEPFKLNGALVENNELPRTDSRKPAALPKEWEEIDIEPLNHIGFTRGHLVQIYKQENIDSQAMQSSIHHFAYDLKYNNKSANITKSSPIGYFMGILKRAGLYNAPDNYESPRDKALREMLERTKVEQERRDAMVKELITIAFENWQATLTQEEKDQLVPEDIKKTRLVVAKLSSLKAYFTENIWPTVAPKELFF